MTLVYGRVEKGRRTLLKLSLKKTIFSTNQERYAMSEDKAEWLGSLPGRSAIR
ncbi:MAG: hypothetical protein ACRESZ_19090 [Methylococcales bacterium]